MDKKSIDALSNLSDAIDQLSQAIIDAKQKPGKGDNPLVQAVDMLSQLKEINQSLVEIKEDNKTMLSKQEELLKITKDIKASKEKEGIFSKVGSDKNNIKDGVSMIVMIAVGVLAIGMAFKLIGKVDFLSVIAISLAIPLITLAFVAMKDSKLTIKDATTTSGSLVIMSVAIALSSIALSFVQPLSFMQLITTVGIAAAFTIISTSIGEMAKDIAGVSVKGLILLPLVLVTTAMSILGASYFLGMVQPVGFVQLITTIGIAAAFTVLSFGIGKLASSLKDVSVDGVLALPLVLVTTAMSILGASYFLGMVQPVGFVQLITTIGIAAVFVVISFGIGKLASSLKDVSVAGVLALPFVLVGLSAAIAGSSYFLGMVQPVSIVQLLTSIGIAAVFVVISFGIAMIVKALSKIKAGDIIKLPLLLVTIAGAIMLSSHILAKTAQIAPSDLLGIVLFSVALTIASIAVGAIMWFYNKINLNLATAVQGGLVILVVAATIMAASQILSFGDYSNYPDWKWSLGVGISLVTFGLSMAVLGMIVMSGIGAVALLAGAAAVLGVAATIVGVAAILNQGDYTKFPSMEWSMSVGLSMAGFALGMTVLGAIIVGTFGLGGVMLEAGASAMLTVAKSIVDVAGVLSGGKFTGGPTWEWSAGVGMAIGAFSPVFATLMKSQVLSIFGGDAMTGEQYGAIMVGIAESIIKVAGVFNAGGVTAWANAPTSEWADGVGKAIGAFAPVYAALDEGLGDKIASLFFGKTDKAAQMSSTMIAIAHAIIGVAGVFAGSKQQYVGGPDKTWGEGVGSAISGFALAYAALEEADLEDADDIAEYDGALLAIVDSIIRVAGKLKNAGDIFGTTVPKSFFDNISANVKSYLDILDGISIGDSLMGSFKLTSIISDITLVANAYAKLAKAISQVGGSMTTLGKDQFESLKYLTANIAMLSLGDTDQMEANIDLLEDKSETLAETFKKMSEEMTKQNELSVKTPDVIKGGVKTGGAAKVTKTNDDLYNALQQIGSKLDGIASSASTLSSYVDELRGKSKPSISNKR